MLPPIATSDWPRLLALVDQALDLPPTQHAAWLQSLDLPGSQAQALRALLDERRGLEADGFLAALPVLPAGAGALAAGSRVGPWRLLRELGQGGMSVVWLAGRDDCQLRRQVALKLPHAGPGQELLARRLLRERHILATLEHPHIARLYDVGLTDAGTPYLVMEWVQGVDLLAWAEARQLTIGQRVALFQQVLRAVQYAHGQLVLHRDLKPANMLVTPAGEVKLLDFGIAKLLGPPGDTSELTRLAGRQLTPGYASPEQLQGQPLGTASDIYALGVILCELLCGQRPHAVSSGSLAQLEAAVLNDEPRLPSRAPGAAKVLRGDLDAIVLKALARDPERRYVSADAFSADLARWQRGRPVAARTPGAAYYVGKFVRRHALAVGAGSAAVLLIAAAAALAAVMGWSARQEAEHASAARDFLLELFAQAAPDRLRGVELTATQLLEQGRRQAEASLGGQPRLQAELLAGIGQTQRQMRDMAGADLALSRAAALFHAEGDAAGEAAARLARLEVALEEARSDNADGRLHELQPLLPVIQANRLLRLRWRRAHGTHLSTSDPAAARLELQQSLALADTTRPAEAEIVFDVRLRLAILASQADDAEQAQAQLQAAGTLAAEGPATLAADRSVALAFARSEIDLNLDRYAHVLAWLPASIAACDTAFGINSQRCGELKQRRLWALLRTGEADRAWRHVPDLDPMLQQSTARYPQFFTAYLLARVLAIGGRTERSLAPIVVLERLVQPEAADPLPVRLQLPTLSSLAIVRLRAGEPDQAEAWLRRADAVLATIAADQLVPERRGLQLTRALVQQARGDHTRALALFGSLCDNTVPKRLIASLASLNCVRSLVASGRRDQATAVVQGALPVLSRDLGAEAPNTRRAQRLLDSLQAPGAIQLPRWDGTQFVIS